MAAELSAARAGLVGCKHCRLLAIGALPDADARTTAESQRPVAELTDRLNALPPVQAAEANAVMTLTGALIDKAADEPRTQPVAA